MKIATKMMSIPDFEPPDFRPRNVSGAMHAVTFLLCGLMAVAVRWIFLQDPVLSDDMGYWGAADRIAAGDWETFAKGRGYLGNRWGMILPVAGLIRLFGASEITYYFLPMSAAFLSGGMTYLIGRRVAGWTEGVVASVFYALIPLSAIANGPLLLPDSITSAWMASSFWLILRAGDRRSAGFQVRWGVVAGLCVAIAYASRLTGLYVIPALVALALWRRRAWSLVGLAVGVAVGMGAEFVLFGMLTGDPLHRFHVAGQSYYKLWAHHNRVDDLGVLFGKYTELLGTLKDRLLWWKLSLGGVAVLLLLGRRRQNTISMWFIAMIGLIHLLMRPEGGGDLLAVAAGVGAGLAVVVGWVISTGKPRRWRQSVPWWAGGLVALAVFLSLKQYPIQRALVHQVRYLEMAAIPGCLLIAMALTLVSRQLGRLWRPLPLIGAGVCTAAIIVLIVLKPHLPIRVFAENQRTVLLAVWGGSLAVAGLILLLVRLLSSTANSNRLAFAVVAAAVFWGMLGMSLLNCAEPIIASNGCARPIGRIVTEQCDSGVRRIYYHNYLDRIARIFGEGVDRSFLTSAKFRDYDDLSRSIAGGESVSAFEPDSLVLMDCNEFLTADANRRRKAASDGLAPPAWRLSDLSAIMPANWRLLDVRNLKGKPRILVWRVHPSGSRCETDVVIPNGDFAEWPRRAKVPVGFIADSEHGSRGRFKRTTGPDGQPAIGLTVTKGPAYWLQIGRRPHWVGDPGSVRVVPDTVYRLTFRASRPATPPGLKDKRVRVRIRIMFFDGTTEEADLVDQLRDSFDVWEDSSLKTFAFRTHPRARALRFSISPHLVNTVTITDLRLIQSHAPLAPVATN